MASANEEHQKQLLDKAGETLLRLSRDRHGVTRDELDKAMRALVEVQQNPARAGLAHEAQEKLDQLNRTRATPSQFVR